ncbi:MAG: DUF72 domain-containing protein [Acidobacteriota bacterium]|nr:DUF72 domain-containing protein [Acidobacteriota bacterium]
MIYAGTSGWAYPSWKPGFYPPKLASKKFLEYYATRLNTVEVNYTFRRWVTEKLATSWLASTPAHFRFTFKAPQDLTHIKRLRDAGDATRSFLQSLQPFCAAGKEKIGVVLFQLPPFLKADTGLLGEFLPVLPKTMRFAFEFRHASWFQEKIYALLREHNVALCIAESEKLSVPEVATADFVYYRLRKGEYTSAERENIRQRVTAHLAAKDGAKGGAKDGDVFVYYKHEDDHAGTMYAEELLLGASSSS